VERSSLVWRGSVCVRRAVFGEARAKEKPPRGESWQARGKAWRRVSGSEAERGGGATGAECG